MTGLAVGQAVLGNTFYDAWCGFAQLVCMGAHSVVPKPERLPFADAAVLPLAGVTALQAVRDFGEVKSGQRVPVQGAGGGVGTFVAQFAHARGAEVTATCGPRTVPVPVLAAFGLNEVVDYHNEDATRRGQTWDVIIAINGDLPLGAFLRCLAPGGTYVMCGGGNRQLFEPILTGWLRSSAERHIRIVEVDQSRRWDDLNELARLCTDGTVRAVIDRTFPLEQLRDAMTYVLEGDVCGKVVITYPTPVAP